MPPKRLWPLFLFGISLFASGCGVPRQSLRLPSPNASTKQRMQAYKDLRYERTQKRTETGTMVQSSLGKTGQHRDGTTRWGTVYKKTTMKTRYRVLLLGDFTVFHPHDLLPLLSKDSKSYLNLKKAGDLFEQSRNMTVLSIGLSLGIGLPATLIGSMMFLMEAESGQGTPGLIVAAVGGAVLIAGVIYAVVGARSTVKKAFRFEQKGLQTYNRDLQKSLKLPLLKEKTP